MTKKKKEERQWLPHMGELIDRMTIHQLKEVLIPEHKDKYSTEMKQIEHDLDMLIEEKDMKLTGELLRAVIIIAQINTHIWYNESNARKGKDQDGSLLRLTHGLNGIRNSTQNLILALVGQASRLDWKTDCLASEFKDWHISLLNGKEKK